MKMTFITNVHLLSVHKVKTFSNRPIRHGTFQKTKNGVCVCVCMRACVHVRKYVRTHARTYVCMYVRTYVRTYVCMYVCMYVPLYRILTATQGAVLSIYDDLLYFQYKQRTTESTKGV